jgi:hypothetical protein
MPDTTHYNTIIYMLGHEITEHYVEMRVLPDERICGVARLLYNWTLHVDIDMDGYNTRYCFHNKSDALEALHSWNGEGDPGDKWHRNPETGRRRDQPGGPIYVAW